MRYRKNRRFRHRSNGRNHRPRDNGVDQMRVRSTFSNDKTRNNLKPFQGAEKLAERYNALAKEALSSGDKITAENYLQFADHYSRVIEEKRSNQNQHKSQVSDEKKNINQNSNLNSEISKDQIIEEKKDQIVEEKKE